ncbi:hypothetical protein ABZW32_17795 [Streptomyces sp. NPDC004667]|uniref:hypothetical protein n=1 Tax=Streptomyces sp. NPDC004667 TaxID=3154285 RepID=UPI0033B0A790
MELGILAAAAVGIAGDFLSGVLQNMAAGSVTDLVRQRLRSTADGARVLERFEGTPQDSGRRMEAAGLLATSARSDASFARELEDAVKLHQHNTHQGTATSGSSHHQVNINGGGVSGKNAQVAGGNIDSRGNAPPASVSAPSPSWPSCSVATASRSGSAGMTAPARGRSMRVVAAEAVGSPRAAWRPSARTRGKTA